MSSRSRLFWWITAAAAVLVAVVGVVVAYQAVLAYQATQTQRQHAQQLREEQVRRAQQTLIAAIGGANARAVQQQLTASGQITPELARSEAAALRSTVDVLLNVGDTAGAFGSADRARQVLEALLATDSGNVAWQRELALTHEKIGTALVA